MFLEIKKTPMLYMQHKDMDIKYITPVTSYIRINLNLVAEVSIYTIKEDKFRKTLDGKEIIVPEGSNVIHMEMSYTHSTHKHRKDTAYEHSVNERYFYKLVFFPGSEAEFVRIKSIFSRLTVE